LKIKADGVEYPFPMDMEMGELRLLKRHFDLSRPMDFDPRNIDHIAGMVFIAKRRASPRLPVDAVIEQVDAIRKVELVEEPGDSDDEQRPTEAADAAESGS
jgi:hypothetical protein